MSELTAWQMSIEKRVAVIERYHGIRHREELLVPAAAPVRPELVAMRDQLRRVYDEAETTVFGIYETGQVDPRPAYRTFVQAYRQLRAFSSEALGLTGDTERFGVKTLPRSPEDLPHLVSIKLRVGPVPDQVDRTAWASMLREAVVR